MSNIEHSKGPWRMDSSAPYNIRDEHCRPIAVCSVYLGPDQEKANAQLIRAAPDLLEALEALYEQAKHEHTAGTLGTIAFRDWPKFTADIQKAERAMTKARGETP